MMHGPHGCRNAFLNLQNSSFLSSHKQATNAHHTEQWCSHCNQLTYTFLSDCVVGTINESENSENVLTLIFEVLNL